MSASAFVGRVGGLAVALGVGAGVVILGAGSASASPRDNSVVSAPGDTAASDDRRPPASRPKSRSRTVQPASEDSAFGGQATAESRQDRSPRGRASVQISPPEPGTGSDGSPEVNNPAQVADASAPVATAAAHSVGEELLVALPPDGPAEPVTPVAQAVVVATALDTGPAPGGPEPAVAAAPSSVAEPAQAGTVEAVSPPWSGPGPGLPGQAALSWVMVAAARRELGGRPVAEGPPAGRVAAGRPLDPQPAGAAAATAAADTSTQSLTPASAEAPVDPITAIFQQVSAVISGIVQAVTGLINGVVAAINQILSAIVSIFIPLNPVPVNTAPTATAPTVSTPDAGTGVVTGQVSATDPDGDTLTYSAPATTAKGSLSINAGTGAFTYTPTAAARENAAKAGATDADKSDTFTVTVTDGNGGSASVPVTVTIGPKALDPNNSAPVAGTPTVGSPDPVSGVVTGKVNATDADNDPLTFSTPAATGKGTVTVNTTTGDFTYTPSRVAREVAGLPGATATDKTDVFTVTVNDGHGGTTSVPVVVTVSALAQAPPPGPSNSAPRITATRVGVPDQSTGEVVGQIIAYDSNNDPLLFSLTGSIDPAMGILTLNDRNGTFSFTPDVLARYRAWNRPETASLSFTISVSDGQADALAVVNVPISPTHPAADGNLDLAGLTDLVTIGAVEIAQNDDLSTRAIAGAFSVNTVESLADAAEVLNSLALIFGAPSDFATPETIATTQAYAADGDVVQQFYRLSQQINGIDVLGSDVVLTTDAEGVVTTVISDYDTRLSTVDTTPTIDADAARATALAAVLAELAANGAEFDQPTIDAYLASLEVQRDLVVYALDQEQPPTLVWRIAVAGNNYYVHANGEQAGSLLTIISNIQDAITQVEANGSPEINLYQARYRWSFPDFWNDVADVPGDLLARGDWDAAALATYYSFKSVVDVYRSYLGRSSYDGLGSPLTVSLGVRSFSGENITRNAAHAGYPDGTSVFLIGAVYGYEYCVDFLGHEFTHAVIASITKSDAMKKGEGGAVNEAYSDIIGNLIENIVEGKTRYDSDFWLFGEDETRDGELAVRNFIDPGIFSSGTAGPYRSNYANRYPFDGPADKGGVHANSTILSHAVYKMVTSIGPGQSDGQWLRVFHNSLFGLPQNPTFKDVRLQVIASARALGFTQLQLDAMGIAFDEVGVSGPSIPASANYLPDAVAVSPTGSRAYVIASTVDVPGNKVVLSVNTAVNRISSVIRLSNAIDAGPYKLAVNPSGTRLYALGVRSLTVIDTSNNVIQSVIPVGGSAVAVSPNSPKIYVYTNTNCPNSCSAAVSVIDTSTNDVTSTITLPGVAAMNLAVSPNGTRLYAATNAGLAVIDATSRTVTAMIPNIYPSDLVVSPDGLKVYGSVVSGAENSLLVINASTNAVSATIPLGSGFRNSGIGLAVSPDGRRVYAITASGQDGRVVAVIDTNTNTVIATISAAPTYPMDLSISADGSRLYVTTVNNVAATAGSIWVVDTASNRIVSTIATLPLSASELLGGTGQ